MSWGYCGFCASKRKELIALAYQMALKGRLRRWFVVASQSSALILSQMRKVTTFDKIFLGSAPAEPRANGFPTSSAPGVALLAVSLKVLFMY